MAGPVYMLGISKAKEAWYQLSEEERESFGAKARAFQEEDGAKLVFRGRATLPGEFDGFSVQEFPDFEALHKHQQHMIELGMNRYIESTIIPATKWEWPS